MGKKIAIVDNSTWNIYNFRLPLIKLLKRKGFEVVVIAPVDNYIHYLNESHFTKHISIRFLSPQSKNPIRDLLFLFELYRVFKEEQPDLILHYTIKPNIFGNLAARLAGIPSISTITGLGYTFLNKNLINRLVPFMYKVALKKVLKLIFYNSDDCQLFIQKKLIDAKRTTVIPGSGVNTNHFRPFPQPLPSQKFVFLFIGRLLYDKGLKEYVAAARYLKQVSTNIECWVIGELNAKNPATVAKAELVEWIDQKHIRYFGIALDVRQYLKRANVLVLPSYREGIPRSVLEAMAMQKPIITTNVAGCKETVETPENGFLVPPKNSEALQEAMLKMYTLNQEALLSMGEKSRIKALAEFDDQIIAKKYLRIINTAILDTNEKRLIPSKKEA